MFDSTGHMETDPGVEKGDLVVLRREMMDAEEPQSGCLRLTSLATRAVALYAPVDAILAHLAFFPTPIRKELFLHLSSDRLRAIEVLWCPSESVSRALQDDERAIKDRAGEWEFEQETQPIWSQRCREQDGAAVVTRLGAKRNARRAFWEQRLRLLLQANASATSSAGQDSASQLWLFRDVVRELKLHGREIIADNVASLLLLPHLQRLEIHHPEQLNTCWSSMQQLIENQHSLRTLGFFHGKLMDSQLQQIQRALQKRLDPDETRLSDIKRLEFVSLKLRPSAFRAVVALVASFDRLVELRITSSMADHDQQALMDAAFASPSLQKLCVQHNELEDSAFLGLAQWQRPIALRQLRLGNNAISTAAIRTISAVCMDGWMALDDLDIMNNGEIGDPGIHALSPMLASSSTLTHLNVRNCHFGLEGATSLLLALSKSATLKHLDMGHNHFGSSFGDILADFLVLNDTLTSLHVNYVGLGAEGCTHKLQQAFAHNTSLTAISLSANRLRDHGTKLLFQALVSRAIAGTVYKIVDLSGNLLTSQSVVTIADIIVQSYVENEQEDFSAARKRQRQTENQSIQLPLQPRIGVLNLRNNDMNDALNSDYISVVRARVDTLLTNKWTGARNVYDDEV